MHLPRLRLFIYLTLILLSSFSAGFSQEQIPEVPVQEEESIPEAWKDFTNDPREGYDFWSEFMQIMSKLAFVIAILLAAAWLLKRAMNVRMEQVNQTSSIRILERRTLSPKSAIYLIEVLGGAYLVGETQAGLHRLADIPKGTDLSGLMPGAPIEEEGRSFSKVLDEQGD